MKAYRLLAACVVGVLTVSTGLAQTSSRDNPKILELFKPVVSKPAESTVLVRYRPNPIQFGPLETHPSMVDACLGTVVGADGWILTKFSELKGSPFCRLSTGKELEANLVGVHKDYDIALLKIEAKDLRQIEWIESKTVLEGHWLATPLVGDKPLALGVVSVPTREKKNWPRRLNPNRGYMGIALDMSVDTPKITQVMPNTGAAKSGAKVGDLIVNIQGKDIKHRDEVFDALGKMKPGDVVTVKVKRKVKNGDVEEEQEVELKATLGRAPADRGDVQDRMGKELSDVRTGFPTFLTHDTVLKPRECGGPIVGIDGKAIGINICSADRTASYAVPSEAILKLLPDMQAGKLPPPGLVSEPTPEELAFQAAKEEFEKAQAELEKLKKALAEQEAKLKDLEKKMKDAEKALPKK